MAGATSNGTNGAIINWGSSNPGDTMMWVDEPEQIVPMEDLKEPSQLTVENLRRAQEEMQKMFIAPPMPTFRTTRRRQGIPGLDELGPPPKQKTQRPFKEGDLIRMLSSCSGAKKGRKYRLDSRSGTLYAVNCCCQYKWVHARRNPKIEAMEMTTEEIKKGEERNNTGKKYPPRCTKKILELRNKISQRRQYPMCYLLGKDGEDIVTYMRLINNGKVLSWLP